MSIATTRPPGAVMPGHIESQVAATAANFQARHPRPDSYSF